MTRCANERQPRGPRRVRGALKLHALWVAACVLIGGASPVWAQALATGEPPAPAQEVWLSNFGQGLAPWREVRLKASLPPNRFHVQAWDGVPALVVDSQQSMSLMARPVKLDLARTPVLCWRWRIDAPLRQANLLEKSGDDYAARLYVSLRIPPENLGFGVRTQLALGRAIWGDHLPDGALNYVWDNRQPEGFERPNAYTDRAVMIVQRSGAAQAGRWVAERRDIGADAHRLFGEAAAPVQLAVTADTDNTGESARAGFAQIHAVARDQPCRWAGDADPAQR
jgi:hypothetical protein